MSYAAKLLALAPASLLLACQAPVDSQPEEASAPQVAEVVAEGFDYTLSHAAIPNMAPSVSGELAFGKAAGVDAMVCVLGSENCVITDADGAFSLDGLEVGASEALFVIAEGHVPLVLPMELGRGEVADVVVDMVPDATFVPIPAGDTHFSAARDGEDVVGDWTMTTPDGSAVFRTRAAAPALSYMPLGTWTATYTPTQRAHCATTLGWSGKEPGEIMFPVMEGAITLVGVSCE